MEGAVKKKKKEEEEEKNGEKGGCGNVAHSFALTL